MIPTLRFARAATCFLRAAIFFPSWGGKCSRSPSNGKFTRAPIRPLRLALSVWSLPFPSSAFLLPAGHLADRFSRKRIIEISQILSAILSAALAVVSWKHLAIPPLPILRHANTGLAAIAAVFERHHPAYHFDDLSVPIIYLLLFLGALVRTFGWAARTSFFPTLVSRDAFANAVTWNNSVFQIGSVVGPAISGLIVAKVGFPHVYAIDAITALIFFLLVVPIQRSTQKRSHSKESPWQSVVAGMRFVLSKKVILATITLDMFAVLLGGATALLPIFADQILHVGPIGLGWLRAAPAVGAFGMALIVAYLPPMRHAGQIVVLVRDRFRNRHDHFRIVESFLALVRHALSRRRIR